MVEDASAVTDHGVSVAAPTAKLPADAVGDTEYVRAAFRLLPRASYVLPDGTPMVPPDHAALLDDAGGHPSAVARQFHERFITAGGNPSAAEEEHRAWLSGECLQSTTPEAIVAKDALMTTITALLARPATTDSGWRTAAGAAIERSASDAGQVVGKPADQFAQDNRRRLVAHEPLAQPRGELPLGASVAHLSARGKPDLVCYGRADCGRCVITRWSTDGQAG